MRIRLLLQVAAAACGSACVVARSIARIALQQDSGLFKQPSCRTVRPRPALDCLRHLHGATGFLRTHRRVAPWWLGKAGGIIIGIESSWGWLGVRKIGLTGGRTTVNSKRTIASRLDGGGGGGRGGRRGGLHTHISRGCGVRARDARGHWSSCVWLDSAGRKTLEFADALAPRRKLEDLDDLGVEAWPGWGRGSWPAPRSRGSPASRRPGQEFGDRTARRAARRAAGASHTARAFTLPRLDRAMAAAIAIRGGKTATTTREQSRSWYWPRGSAQCSSFDPCCPLHKHGVSNAPWCAVRTRRR
jgi:hypothetical protein